VCVVADYAAPPAEDAGEREVRGRLSGWTLLVTASAAVLVAAAVVMAALWAATTDRNSTSYAVSGALLGIELSVTNGSVEVIGGGNEVQVRRVERSLFGHEPTEQRTVTNGVLRISSECVELVMGSCTADYRVSVPESISVTITADRGDVRLNSFRGSAQLSTGGGSIAVDAFCGFVLQATARGGSIDVSTICSPERLELRTDSGDVHAAVPAGRYSIDADSNVGTVAVRGLEQADDAPWAIQALSSTGDVTLAAGS
jgi:Putative adhesin